MDKYNGTTLAYPGRWHSFPGSDSSIDSCAAASAAEGGLQLLHSDDDELPVELGGLQAERRG